jgi:hypothetical protein
MATYFGPPRSVWGPVGPVVVRFEYDDGGTPQADPYIDDDPAWADDVIVNVHWRNPNPQPASMVVTFQTSGMVVTFILTENTPNDQIWPVPQNYQARIGRLTISGPNYPATVTQGGKDPR